jgi:hypothetical protein
MTSQSARVIDLDSYRKAKAAKAEPVAANAHGMFFVAWMPMWIAPIIWVPDPASVGSAS